MLNAFVEQQTTGRLDIECYVDQISTGLYSLMGDIVGNCPVAGVGSGH